MAGGDLTRLLLLLGVLCAVAATPASAAPNQVDLLQGANIRIDGSALGDNAGNRVSAVGDLNGDGVGDIAISASSSNPQDRTEGGVVYVVYGGSSTSLEDLELSALGPRGFKVEGAGKYETIGWGLDRAGDFNDDGIDDLLISGPGTYDDGERLNVGAAWVIYGEDAADIADLDLADLETTAGARAFRAIGPQEEARLGYAVAGTGDVNGDDIDDVMLGAPGIWTPNVASGAVFVVYGKATADVPDLDLADLPTTAGSRAYKISGGPRDGLGEKVAAAGDFNGDGVGDLVLGSPYSSNEGVFGQHSHGGAYVVYGGNVADPPDLSLADISTSAASRGMRVRGDSNLGAADCCGSLTGWSVAGGLDANADGRDDVIVGAVNTGFNGRTNSGSIYVVYGSGEADPADLDLGAIATTSTQRGMRLDGEAANDRVGQSAAAIGDLNGDGREDFAFGSTGADNNGREESGSAYVVFGRPVADPSDLDLRALVADPSLGFRIDGAEEGDRAGHALAGIGDFTGDGRDDLLVGAPHYPFGEDGEREDGSGAAFIPQLIAQPGPPLSFAPQLVGTASPTQVATLTEMSGNGLEVEGVALAGASPGQFEIVSDGCGGAELDLNQSCEVSVRFTPSGAGETKHAVLRFFGNGSNAPQEVGLRGEAIPDPSAADDLATVAEDPGGPVAIDVLANDTDTAEAPITISTATEPGHGTVILTGGSPGARTGLTYEPDPDYCNEPPGTAPDSFQYTVNGGDSATVAVRVSCVDDPPTAVPETIVLVEDSPPVTVPVTSNDKDADGGPRSIASASDPSHGTVVLTGGAPGAHATLTYEPDPDYCNEPPGTEKDTFTYTLGGGSSATVSAQVECVDDDPEPVNDFVTTSEDTPIEIDVLANDLNGDGGAQTITSVTDAIGGTAEVAGDGESVRFVPAPDFCIPSGRPPGGFSYAVNDAAAARVAVHVTCVDDAPRAAEDAAVVEENGSATIDVLANDTDIDGGPKLIQGVVQPAHGVAAVSPGGGIDYRPHPGYCGPDQLAYTLNGGSAAGVVLRVACDTTAPQTHLVNRPAARIWRRGKSPRVKFKLASSEPGGFECRIDRRRFAPCASRVTFRLDPGAHRFVARAVDLAGNIDQTPVVTRFKILLRPQR